METADWMEELPVLAVMLHISPLSGVRVFTGNTLITARHSFSQTNS